MSQIVDVTHDLATDLWDWPLQINLSGDHLFIYCHHEERVDEHGWVKRELHRSYKVPEDVDTGTIRSHFTPNGILQLKALKKHAARRPSINVAVIAEEEPKKEKPKYGAAALAAQKPGKKLVVEVENAKIARPISPRENLFASAANFCSTQMPLGPFGWSANNGTLVGKS
uniref:SHSP domain-containing protein n=1 Tax=Globodera pallida TaxID=36090 RepID=A0A183BRH7_GLOPA